MKTFLHKACCLFNHHVGFKHSSFLRFFLYVLSHHYFLYRAFTWSIFKVINLNSGEFIPPVTSVSPKPQRSVGKKKINILDQKFYWNKTHLVLRVCVSVCVLVSCSRKRLKLQRPKLPPGPRGSLAALWGESVGLREREFDCNTLATCLLTHIRLNDIQSVSIHEQLQACLAAADANRSHQLSNDSLKAQTTCCFQMTLLYIITGSGCF